MFSNVILSLLLLFPFFAGLVTLSIPSGSKGTIKSFALYVSLMNFIISLIMYSKFENVDGFQFINNIPWNTNLGISYKIGVDGISLFLVMITTFFIPVAILSTWNVIKEKEKMFYSCILFLETFLLGSTLSMDMFLFYTFWELMLIPMFFMVGVWSESKKIYITAKFFVFTMIGSLGMLFSLLYVYQLHYKQTGIYTFDMLELYNTNISPTMGPILFLLFLLAFAVKAPLFPFHTWLPDTYTDAPVSATIVLSSVMAKIGVYGIIRFVIPLFPVAFSQYSNLLMTLAAIGIIYGGLIAIVQKDMKRLIAYSSISHLGYIILGVFAFNLQALQGSIFQMVNHALSTGALFLLVAFLESRIKTRKIENMGGLMTLMPGLGLIFMLAMFSSVGLPGLNGFVGEFLIFLGVFGKNPVFSVLATTGIIISAIYMLWSFQRIMFGKLNTNLKVEFKSLRASELMVLIPISALIIILGVYPQPFLNKIEPSVSKYIDFVNLKRINNQEIASLSHK
ncbi:MAG: NADH-quinone oxidoreductase subunit M [Candidatus Sericytochromatia bacterium]|nr:NADH-quinone oxidoreductase subunit M [Candidatus Sericytochromatia bacterium]